MGPSYRVRVSDNFGQQPQQPYPPQPRDPYAPQGEGPQGWAEPQQPQGQPAYGQHAPQGQPQGGHTPPQYYGQPDNHGRYQPPAQPGPVGRYGQPLQYHPPAQPWVKPDAEFHELTRGAHWSWWRPLASLGLLIPLGILVFIVMTVAILVPMVAMPDQMSILDPTSDGPKPPMHPFTFFGLNIGLAALIPLTIAAIAIAFWIRPGFVTSVAGRWRWGWSMRVLLVLLPWWVAFMVGLSLITGESFATQLHQHFWGLLLVVLITTPLQSAGEEYFFRGWIMQWFGSWVPWRWLALALAAVASTALFALAHGSMDPWVLADLGLFAIVAVWLTVRTGGLEAAIVMHAVNNVTIMVLSLVFGGFEDGFVSQETTSTPMAVVVSLVMQGVAVALVEWQWRRSGHSNRTASAEELVARRA